MLVCSYTVMTLRIEKLECVEFSTIVLDEAQAIKNGATQRASAARRLVGETRVALSGTGQELLADEDVCTAYLGKRGSRVV